MTRITWLRIGFGVAFCVVGVRLFDVQIVRHEEYVAKASEAHVKKFVLPARRGMIYMMDGENPVPVVMNEGVYTIFVDPKMVGDRMRAVEKVIDAVVPEEKRVGSWKEAWSDPENQYYVVGRGLTRREAEKIKGEELAGVGFSEDVKRVYPRGMLAAQTLGFVNAEGQGQYGVEGTFDDDLSGTDGLLQTVTDVNSVPLTIGDENVKMAAKNGKDVVLSIDSNIQLEVEKALARGIERTGGEYASAVVMNPNSGRVLAMANLPTYDPGNYGEVKDASVYQNAALVAAYEPASVCKTFTFAMAVDKGVLSPEDIYNNAGSVTIGGHKINNANKAHLGEISFQEAMNFSLNTGSVEALRRADGASNFISRKAQDTLYEYFHNRFGLGEKTGLGLYEEQGQVISPGVAEGSGAEIRYANMTFGQGLTVTMLQIASAYSAIMNGGEYYQPTVVAGEMENGKFVAAEEKGPVRRVVSESTSAVMRKMLVDARNRADLPKLDPAGYTMGAKSGTAETLRDGKYVMDTTIATYAGFGGGELPEYVIVVRIGGEGKNLDGYMHAGPIWTEISNYLVGYLKVMPGQ